MEIRNKLLCGIALAVTSIPAVAQTETAPPAPAESSPWLLVPIFTRRLPASLR